jgi:hypothetical protein
VDVGAAAPSAIGPRGPRGVQKKFPARVSEIAKTVGPGKTCELWFTDESRVGQKGRLTRVWHTKGDRPEGLRDHRFRSAWIFGAVCPERDTGEALVCTHIGTASMNAFLAELAKAIPEDRHAIVLMDQAGWHLSGTLAVPANITLVPLPPYSPELKADRAVLAAPQGPLAVQPRLRNPRRCRPSLLRRLERRPRRDRNRQLRVRLLMGESLKSADLV